MAVAEERRLSAGGSVLLLTGMGAVSHVLGFFYRVALSRMVGAEVMGLYQLVMPVFSVVLSCTAVGLTAAVSNLTAGGRTRYCEPAFGGCWGCCCPWERP